MTCVLGIGAGIKALLPIPIRHIGWYRVPDASIGRAFQTVYVRIAPLIEYIYYCNFTVNSTRYRSPIKSVHSLTYH